ncbi:hypothetical protein [Methylobacterium sp. J-092]|uniref:hypothetical protein n=1 Tax=Methylobacterium sp. J-092 TaxID=2836667 RepID=UPI001FB9DF13|nr:hypothetical protein [Methylobacterium sp. J-092]MCJ2009180.1 hypothetical protein [Methylobacterium sp. J-092]
MIRYLIPRALALAILLPAAGPAFAQVRPAQDVPSKSYVDTGLAANSNAIGANVTALLAEVTRAKAAESASATAIATNATNITAEIARAQAAEGVNAKAIVTNATNIATEVARAQAAESLLAPLANPAFSGAVSTTGAFRTAYTSAATGSILYGYTANVKGAGAGTDLIVGDQINAYNIGTGTRLVFGGAREAWSGDLTTAPSATSTLIGFEPAVISQHDANDQPLVGLDTVFKNRRDGATSPIKGLGANGYNLYSRGIQISAQARSSAGEYSGWSCGVCFTPNSLDRTSAGLAVGIDMSAVDSTRLASAFRMPANGKVTWDGDVRKFGVSDGALVYTVAGATPFSVSSAGNITLPANAQIAGPGGGSLTLGNVASAVNTVRVTPAVTGGNATIDVYGDTSANLFVKGAGSGSVYVQSTLSAGYNFPLFSQIAGAGAGGSPTITAAGSDANIAQTVKGKGTSGVLTGAFVRTADPTTTDIPAGQCADWNNVTAATFKHVCNFGGTLRAGPLS